MEKDTGEKIIESLKAISQKLDSILSERKDFVGGNDGKECPDTPVS